MNNTITPAENEMLYDGTANYIAMMMMTAWIWGLIAFVITWDNPAPAASLAAPAPAQPTPSKGSDWVQIGNIEVDGHTTTLYERTYKSGKKAWRFQDECDNWVYPRRRELVYTGAPTATTN